MSRILETPPPPIRDVPRARHARHAPRSDDEQYAAFGNVETRNGLQELVEIPLLLRALALPMGGRVLEVGCGRGVALPVLTERLAPEALVGIDVDAALIAVAADRIRRWRTRPAGQVTVHVADVRDLPFESGSFDLVIDFGTCYHVGGGRVGARLALQEISRVLRRDGLFVHETRVAQGLAHPVRSFGRTLPWGGVPELVVERHAVLWSARRKVGRRERR